LKKTQKHSDLIYDVGLNLGQDTDFYLKKGFRVIAFEADPDSVQFCRNRFADAIKDGKLIIVEGAISEIPTSLTQPAQVKFYRNVNHSLWGSTSDEWAYRNEVMGTANETMAVDAINFAECLEKYGIPFYLKADIVGSEKICLKALLQFENKPDYLSIRSEKVIFSKLLEEFELLGQLGYGNFKAIQQDVTNSQTVINNGSAKTYTFQEGASGVFGEETAGNWKTYDAIVKEYRRIFTLYWLFGDYSYLIQTEKGKYFISQLERVVRRPLPGWYDTHAKHSSLLSLIGAVCGFPAFL
jgi:FkbM family methyltransferase